MSEWQPIETAPKDGTVIDLWVCYSTGEGFRATDAYWCEQGFDYGPDRCDGKPGWAAAHMGWDGAEGYADNPADGDVATHWMPIPQPPLGTTRWDS